MEIKYFFFIFVLFSFLQGKAQTYADLIIQAGSAYNNKSYLYSLQKYEGALKIDNKIYSRSYFYDMASCAIMLKNKEKALKYLKLAYTKTSSENINYLKKDTLFNLLHNQKNWKFFLQNIEKKQAKKEAKYNKILQAELLKIHESDQLAASTSHMPKQQKDSIFNINFSKIENIIKKYGWLGNDKVGRKANNTIFLVIQHTELQNQLKYLPIMRKAVKKGNASASSLALLEDRIALKQGKKQIYGSQIYFMQGTGQPYVAPLEDPDNVDKRRKSIGLEPIKIYLNDFRGTVWNVEKFKKEQIEREKNIQK